MSDPIPLDSLEALDTDDTDAVINTTLRLLDRAEVSEEMTLLSDVVAAIKAVALATLAGVTATEALDQRLIEIEHRLAVIGDALGDLARER